MVSQNEMNFQERTIDEIEDISDYLTLPILQSAYSNLLLYSLLLDFVQVEEKQCR